INHIIRINVPSKNIRKIKNLTLINNKEYNSELDRHIFETKSLTLFFNFQYLNTFYKIFENLMRRSDFIKKYFIDSSKPQAHDISTNDKVASISMPFEPLPESKKDKSTLLLSLFDLKIIYLVQYKS